MRNMTVNYRGGSYSRAGTAFVGYSKQTTRSYPPRVIQYQFSINQGLALEFGNFYMRVISNGAYVINPSYLIGGISNASPAVLTVNGLTVSAAAPINTNVTASYAPNDTITVAGGTYTTPAVLSVTTTTLLAVSPNAAGSGYAPADTITLSGGVASPSAVVTVATTQVSGLPTINAAGSGGAGSGAGVVQGTTGTGTKFQAAVTISGGAITAVTSLTLAGSYTVNPTTPAMEPVVWVSGAGSGLTGAKLAIALGVKTVTLTTAGVFTTNPNGLAFTQASSSGGGSGATFNSALFGVQALGVVTGGPYSTTPTNPASQLSTSGTGFGLQMTLITIGGPPFQTGDWVYLSNVGGMLEVNQQTYVVTRLSSTTFALYDAFGNPVDSTHFGGYTSGGSAASLYTVTTIYAEQDLEYLKFTQSADVMSITCVNSKTGAEYPPQDLTRVSDTDWSFAGVVTTETTLPPPGTVSGVASSSGNANYGYVVTAIDPKDGTESIASAIANITSAVDIATTAGSITLTWNASPTTGVNEYYVYRASISYDTPVPSGALYGYVGTAYGTQFVDGNIVPDFSQVPPRRANPFARGQALSATITSGGSGYTYATASIISANGTGAVFTVVVNVVVAAGGSVTPGPVSALILQAGGQGYQAGDQIIISGDGSGAQATLNVGAQSGTYPSVVNYFQQRRVYANTLNNPDTYFMSQPGAYTNFDSRVPTIASDAIIGTPWSLQVNGIQWLVPTTPGLLVMTGESAWLLAGVGSFATNVQPISPSSQNAIPQAFSGCSSTVPPQRINYSVLYVDSKQAIYYELPYQLYALSEPIDLTENSSHLFVGYSIREHAWCEQPNKILWAVRNDGVLLSLTFLKAQQIAGWARHDTQGSFVSVCSVTEPPVDALYCVTQRTTPAGQAYFVERMDNRIWPSVENCWCVDAGLQLAQPTPAASLTAGSATGVGSISGFTNLVGGANYSDATTAWVVDDNGDGPGSGAKAALTIVGGVIKNITFPLAGVGYAYPALVISDPLGQGSGASATLTLDNSATFTASAPVFSASNVGSVIRMGGGIASITSFVSSTEVIANVLSPITALIPNTGPVFNEQEISDIETVVTLVAPNTNGLPAVAASGTWTMTQPTSTVRGLTHLAGMTVTGLADGNVIPPTIVSSSGTVTLTKPASAITIGLPFTAQLQGVYLDAGEPTVQGQRAKIAAVTVRWEASLGASVGANQPDGSTFKPTQLAPLWGSGDTLQPIPATSRKPYNALAQPLCTGDVRLPITGGFDTRKQIAAQQALPLPLQVLAFINEIEGGDTPEVRASPRQQSRGRGSA